jgi:fumarylacetoacetate (FAA) hydrolase
MKLASLDLAGRDGRLVVVDRTLHRCVAADAVAPTLQAALDDWDRAAPALAALARDLEAGRVASIPFEADKALAPLPRGPQFLDGSAYLSHIELVRRSRGADMPDSLLTDPLMYQGCSAPFMSAHAPLPSPDPSWGLDYEGEIGILTGDVPAGVSPTQAGRHIRLLVLLNDVSLRGLIPTELAKGFGFVHGKPPSALAPVAVTPDEAADAWDGSRLHLGLSSHVNGQSMGCPQAGLDMQFGFPELVAHAAKTRPLAAGTLIGGGTVSNFDRSQGFACLMERRMWEKETAGAAKTPFLVPGDEIRLDVRLADGSSLFGEIRQKVAATPARAIAPGPGGM